MVAIASAGKSAWRFESLALERVREPEMNPAAVKKLLLGGFIALNELRRQRAIGKVF